MYIDLRDATFFGGARAAPPFPKPPAYLEPEGPL